MGLNSETESETSESMQNPKFMMCSKGIWEISDYFMPLQSLDLDLDGVRRRT